MIADVRVVQNVVHEVGDLANLVEGHVHVTKTLRKAESPDELRHPIGTFERGCPRVRWFERNAERRGDRTESLRRHVRREPHRMWEGDARRHTVCDVPSRTDL